MASSQASLIVTVSFQGRNGHRAKRVVRHAEGPVPKIERPSLARQPKAFVKLARGAGKVTRGLPRSLSSSLLSPSRSSCPPAPFNSTADLIDLHASTAASLTVQDSFFVGLEDSLEDFDTHGSFVDELSADNLKTLRARLLAPVNTSTGEQ